MRFPESTRVRFQSNPLAEVICQLRYPRVLRIDEELPAAFQEAIWDTYPNVREQRTISLPPEVARLAGVDPTTIAQRSFDFASTGGEWKVSLTSQFLALSATEYTTWVDFWDRLDAVLAAFSRNYPVATFGRIGLRYRDIIQRSKLQLADRPWSELLRRELLGELVADGLQNMESDTEHLAREAVFRLDEVSKVRLYHGFGSVPDLDEVCYVIDADFFHPGPTRREDARAILDTFNREAGNLFRWCIAKPLRDAMGPEED